MKTPMQELIDHLEKWMLDDKHVQDNPMKYEEYMVQHANQMVSVKRDFVILCESLLEKEKEMIINAFISGDNSDCLQEQDSKLFAEQYYNETFNTKETCTCKSAQFTREVTEDFEPMCGRCGRPI